MSVSLTIHPLHDDLDMFGAADLASAYSLSGHVSVSVTSPYSLFEARQPARLLLQSLSLTFEGQSEIVTTNTGYSSIRLCSVSRELVPCEPIELSNEGHDDLGAPCVWNIIFNLPIPGWLPATTSLGTDEVGIRYGLYASAKFVNLDEELSSSWSFSALCAPFRSRFRTAESSRRITLRRFIAAPKAEMTGAPMSNFLVNATPCSSKVNRDKARISPDILCKIQVLASVPEYIDVDDNVLPITLRIRSKDLAEEHCKRLQLTEVTMDITQRDKCRNKPSPAYLAQYPVPPKELQPPNLPLREGHALSSIYEVGLLDAFGSAGAVSRSFSLLAPSETGSYKMGEKNYIFADDAKPEAIPSWYTMDTTLPFVHRSSVHMGAECLEWAGPPDIRPSTISPLFSVVHDVAVSLQCTYDLENGEVARERLSFKIPLTFGKVARMPAAAVDSRKVVSQGPQRQTTPVPAPTDSSLSLPAYSQLYDHRGERKVDYSVPLPLYTPRPSPSTRLDSSSNHERMPLMAMDIYDDEAVPMQKPGLRAGSLCVSEMAHSE